MLDEQKSRFPAIISLFSYSEKLASYRYLKWFVAALLPIVIFLKYPVEPFDYDLWWQMALGRYYLTHHTLVIDHSIFSWTPADASWIYNTCLGSIILYLIYSFMGGFGLWIFQWLIFLGIFLSFYIFLRILQQRLDISSLTLIAAIGITCSVSCRFYKPEMFSTLLLCLMAVIFLCVKLTRRRYFYLYPFIFALWVNLHGGFLLGLSLLACFFFGELLNRIFFPHESFTTKELVHLLLACVLSLAATLLNPYGINYLLSIYNAAMSPQAYNINSEYIQAYVSLWPYFQEIKNINVSFFRMGQAALIMAIMMMSLLSLFIYQFIKKRSCDFTVLILNVATFWGSMRAVRANYMFPLAFFFSLFYLLHSLKLKRISGKATIFSLLIFILLFVNNVYFVLRYENENKWFGSGLESFAPVEEVAFLKKYHMEGHIFNDYLIGGYLLWDLYPDYKVFIDPRHVPFSKQVASDYWKLVSKPATGEDIHRFTQKYPFKIAIIHYREMPLIFDFLKAGWRLLYFEKNAAIVVHPSILSQVPPEVKLVDLGPTRFQDVKNPFILLNVFSLYVNLNPESSVVIYDIYKKNISDFYKLKSEHLSVMENDIRQKQLQLRNE